MYSYYEFFCGGGMARAGLDHQWRCLFANDFDRKKNWAYIQNYGNAELNPNDVRNLKSEDIPDIGTLAWASFPCQDLSLAGGGAGLKGNRSGTFWPFWEQMKNLIREDRGPAIITLENVCGTLHSHGGKDFGAICAALQKSGYRYGAIVIDAALFVPQSRPRLFIIGVKENIDIPESIIGSGSSTPWHTYSLINAYNGLPETVKNDWIWWKLPMPQKRVITFADIIEKHPTGVTWHSPEETLRLIGMMSKINRAKVEKAKKARKTMVGAIYKRTRFDENGYKVQRAEIRFDEIAGCLRTPAGGSSRQVIMIVNGDSITSRLISSRETARLMGLPDTYILPNNYNEAYHITGDGVVVPVVRHLTEHILEPIAVGVGKASWVAA